MLKDKIIITGFELFLFPNRNKHFKFFFFCFLKFFFGQWPCTDIESSLISRRLKWKEQYNNKITNVYISQHYLSYSITFTKNYNNVGLTLTRFS